MKVGITGHQEFESKDVQRWVEAQIRLFVLKNQIEVGFTCLARGADQIFARVLLDHNIPYIAIIPSADYEDTFPDETTLTQFEYLRTFAAEVKNIGYAQATEEAFFEASKELVNSSDHIVAIWNGNPAKSLGGTADVVKYALEQHKPVLHIHTGTLTVRDMRPAS